MPKIWHLAHQTPKILPHEVCQMPNRFGVCYSSILLIEVYSKNAKHISYYSIKLFSLLHISLSLSLSLSPPLICCFSLISISSFLTFFFLLHSLLFTLFLSLCRYHHAMLPILPSSLVTHHRSCSLPQPHAANLIRLLNHTTDLALVLL